MLVTAGRNHLISRERSAVQQIERLAGRGLGVRIEHGNLADDLAGLQGKPCAATNQSTAADDTDFHKGASCSTGFSARPVCRSGLALTGISKCILVVSGQALTYFPLSAASTRSVISLTSAS